MEKSNNYLSKHYNKITEKYNSRVLMDDSIQDPREVILLIPYSMKSEVWRLAADGWPGFSIEHGPSNRIFRFFGSDIKFSNQVEPGSIEIYKRMEFKPKEISFSITEIGTTGCDISGQQLKMSLAITIESNGMIEQLAEMERRAPGSIAEKIKNGSLRIYGK